MKKETRQITGPQYFRAQFDAKTIDKDKRTVDVTFATEREVVMYNWNVGRIREILICDDTAGNLDRLNAGAPLTDMHTTDSVRTILGSVVKGSARFENGVGTATVQFSKRKDVEDVFNDVIDGHISGVSIGYTVYEYEVTESLDNQLPLYRATKWEGTEIALATVQADPDSKIRSNEKSQSFDVTIITKSSNSNTMTEAEKKAKAERQRSAEILKECRAANLTSEYAQELIEGDLSLEECRAAINTKKAEAPAPSGNEDAAKIAVAAERARVKDINAAVRAVKLGDEFAQQLVDNGSTIEQARKLIIDKLASAETAEPSAQSGVRVGADETDKRNAVIINALKLRSGAVSEKSMKAEDISAAREFRPWTLMEVAKDALKRAGVDFRFMDKMEIAERAITSNSTDFPVLLGGVIHQTLLANYAAIPDSWRNFCAVGSVSDFRPYKRLRMGSFSRLDKVQENGEFKNKKISDGTFESIEAETFGNTINVSRKMIVNDDLAFIARLSGELGRAAARSIEIDAYALLASNPEMEDGTPLFHADHGNLVAGSVMSVASFDEIKNTIGMQMDPDKNDYVGITPSLLICPLNLGGNAKVINGSQYDPDAANKLQRVNKSFGLFDKIVDSPRVSGTKYYGFADPNVEPVLEVSFLDGNQTPFLETRMGFATDGMEWKVRHDYAVGAIGFRGAVLNPGA